MRKGTDREGPRGTDGADRVDLTEKELRKALHELNNHLASILTNVEVIQIDLADRPEVFPCLQDIRIATRNAYDTIASLTERTRGGKSPEAEKETP